ncbi:MAG: SDR family NAD(P)-dependent oxidoreductase [Bacteroidetes bacterium]|nr:SDR family NAD(P)-dependent oxidoreductase [Bacteroidota bacterium]
MESKQVSVVTGASKGIGRAIALKLSKEGHSLAVFGRNESQLNSLINEIKNNGNEAVFFTGDIADKNFVDKSISETINLFGKIDNLINNAGVAVFKKFIDSELEEFQRQVDTNLYGIYNFTKAVLPQMMERKSGVIINIASLAGKNGFAGGTMYAATKHAVLGFSKSLMLEVREYNIKVSAVCPGSVATELITNTVMAPTNIDKILSPNDIAETVAFVINLPVSANLSELDIRPTNPK